MPLQIPCPSCSHIVRVPPMHHGRTLRCPTCETQIELPRTTPPKLQGNRETASNQPTPPPISESPSRSPAAVAADTADAGGDRAAASGATRKDSASSPPPLARSQSRNEAGKAQRVAEPPGTVASPDPAEAPGDRQSPDETKERRKNKCRSYARQLQIRRGGSVVECREPPSGDGSYQNKADSRTSDVPKKPAARSDNSSVPPPLPPPKPSRATAAAVKSDKPDRVESQLNKTKPSPDKAKSESDQAKAPEDETEQRPAATAGQTKSNPPDEAPPAENASPTRGYEHNADKRWTVYYLAMALAVAAIFGIVPAVLDVVQHFQSVHSTGISRWAWILLLLGGVQIGYAVFLFQLPDWASVWVVSVVTLGFATGYAMLLGLLLLADGQSQVIRFLELTDRSAGYQATGWCLIMLSISILLAYFSGRIGTAWHRAYRLATEDASTDGASAAD